MESIYPATCCNDGQMVGGEIYAEKWLAKAPVMSVVAAGIRINLSMRASVSLLILL